MLSACLQRARTHTIKSRPKLMVRRTTTPPIHSFSRSLAPPPTDRPAEARHTPAGADARFRGNLRAANVQPHRHDHPIERRCIAAREHNARDYLAGDHFVLDPDAECQCHETSAGRKYSTALIV